MTRKNQFLAVLISGLIFQASNGCAMLTAKTVGTFVATEVGKEVGKKAVKDLKEEHDKKKAAEERQTAQSSQP